MRLKSRGSDLIEVVRLQWDRAAALALMVAGGVMLVAGWLGVSRTAYPAEQVPYILSAGIGALFVLGCAATLWLSADLRDEWRKLDRIERELHRLAGTTLVEPKTSDGGRRRRRSRTSTR